MACWLGSMQHLFYCHNLRVWRCDGPFHPGKAHRGPTSDGYDEPSSSPATLTSTSLNSLVERIEALESQVTMRDEEFYEFKEVDIVRNRRSRSLAVSCSITGRFHLIRHS